MTNSRNMFWLLPILLTLTATALAQTKPEVTDYNVLVFSKTLMFRHASITNGIAAIKLLGAENRFHVDATEDAGWFTPANLTKYKVVIFLSTSGDILNEEQQGAFKNFIERGGGLAAIHAGVAGMWRRKAPGPGTARRSARGSRTTRR